MLDHDELVQCSKKGILKNGSFDLLANINNNNHNNHSMTEIGWSENPRIFREAFFSCNDLRETVRDLPEDMKRRKALVIEELRENFNVLLDAAKKCNKQMEICKNANFHQHQHQHQEQQQQQEEKSCKVARTPLVLSDVETSSLHRKNSAAKKPEFVRESKNADAKNGFSPLSSSTASSLSTSPGSRSTNFSEKSEEKKTSFSEKSRRDDLRAKIEDSIRRIAEKEKLDKSKKCIEKSPDTEPIKKEEEKSDNRAEISDEKLEKNLEENLERPTKKEIERERRKAVREQTVLTKPLRNWRLPSDSSAEEQNRTLPPERRLATLRNLDKEDVFETETPKKLAAATRDFRKASPPPSTLSSCSSSTSSFMYMKKTQQKQSAMAERNSVAPTTENAHGKTVHMAIAENLHNATVRRRAKTPETLFVDTGAPVAKSYISPSAQAVSPDSLIRLEETKKVRRLWEQRIDEHERWRQQELNRPRHAHKRWKSLEVLSASLLAVQDQTEPHSIAATYWPPPDPPRIRDPLFTFAVDYLRGDPDEHHYTDFHPDYHFDPYQHRGHLQNSNMVVETENGHPKEEASGGLVLHESIADAGRTRNMWQQKAAATQLDNGSGPAVSHVHRPVVSGVKFAQQHPQQHGHSQQSQMHQVHHQMHQMHSPQSHQSNVHTRTGPSSIVERHIQEFRSKENRSAPVPGPGPYMQQQQHVAQHLHNVHSAPGQHARYVQQQQHQQQQHHHQQQVSPPQKVHPDQLENEKQLFMAYMHSHPDVVGALGINVPWHLRQRYQQQQQHLLPPNVKVELALVEDYHARATSVISPQSAMQNGHGHYGAHGMRAHTLPHPPAGRYIKNGHAAPATNGFNSLTHGSQKKIVRRQSQTLPDNSGHGASSTMPRHWRLPEWSEPPAPVNKNVNEEDGYVDTDGNVYRSIGESIIAKEIREYRAREEELRRSRSELGLPNLEDLMENWKGPGSRMREAQSYDHLQDAIENDKHGEHAYITQNGSRNRSGSVDRLQYWAAEGGARSASADLSNPQNRFLPIDTRHHSPKSPHEKFLQAQQQVIGGGGHKVAAYPPNGSEAGSALDEAFSPTGGRKKVGGDFVPVEARIEQEVEELRRREEELKLQREAMGIRYTPIGLQSISSEGDFSNGGEENGCISACKMHIQQQQFRHSAQQQQPHFSNGIVRNRRDEKSSDDQEMEGEQLASKKYDVDAMAENELVVRTLSIESDDVLREIELDRSTSSPPANTNGVRRAVENVDDAVDAVSAENDEKTDENENDDGFFQREKNMLERREGNIFLVDGDPFSNGQEKVQNGKKNRDFNVDDILVSI